MRGHKRQLLDEVEDDQYDMGILPDLEKHDSHTRNSSIESDEYTITSTGSSRETSRSHQPMMRTSPVRKAKSHYAYRLPNRLVRWLCLALMSTIVLFILSLVRASWISSKHVEMNKFESMPTPFPWESFPFLTRYHGGIQTLVPFNKSVAEYPPDYASPVQGGVTAPSSLAEIESTAVDVHPTIPDSEDERGVVQECYLDEDKKLMVPSLRSYAGVPEGLPGPVIGSYEAVGLEQTACFDRYGRLGPYGYGYSLRKGGSGAGLTGEKKGSEKVWEKAQEIDYRDIRWADVQKTCANKNSHRYAPLSGTLSDRFRDMDVNKRDDEAAPGRNDKQPSSPSTNHTATKNISNPLPRTAFIVRTWWDYQYSREDILYLRSLMVELGLQSGGEYTLHFLIHVKDDNAPIWADPETYQRVLADSLPKEFQGMGTLWSERQMSLIYGGLQESFYRDLPVHGVYRSTFLPMQYFAHQHPEYDFFWNWEMDIRYTGHWYNLISNVQRWAKKQPRKGLWERNARFYIPSEHGTWEDFKQMVRVQSEMPPPKPANLPFGAKAGPPTPESGNTLPPPIEIEKPIWGPLPHEDTISYPEDPQPNTTYSQDNYAWGVGEEADFISLSPIFDPTGTTWLLADDVTGYNTTLHSPPRRAAVITASRLSKKLLATMHKEVALQRHLMFSEMWPASCALHHGLKAVYVPHPVYVDRKWPTKYLAGVLNGGKNGASGGARTSVYGEREHNFRGTSWYYNSGFAPSLWKRWLGYRVDNDGGEEEELAGEGRMCLPPMLLHPIKSLELVVEGVEDEVKEAERQQEDREVLGSKDIDGETIV